MKKLNKLLFFIALAVGLSSQSFANPVLLTYDFQVGAGNQAAVANAASKFSKSKKFSEIQGAMYLNSYDFGGTGSHSFAVFHKSPTAANDFVSTLNQNPDFIAFASSLNNAGSYLGAAYYNVVKTWNPPDGTGKQFQTLPAAITNVSGAIKAMDTWTSTAEFKSLNASLMLLEQRAGGAPGATHAFVVLYDNRGAYEEAWTVASASKNWRAAVSSFSRHGRVLGSLMGSPLAEFGDTTKTAEMLK